MTGIVKYNNKRIGDYELPMKVEELNVSIIDMNGAENCKLSFKNLPSEERIIKKIQAIISSLHKEGVSEIGKLNIAVVDLSDAEKIEII